MDVLAAGEWVAHSNTCSPSIQTKIDAKFDATTHLLLTASRLSSAANVLDEYVKVISSDNPVAP
jgi:hypothetical protein